MTVHSRVRLGTALGEIEITLDHDRAPLTSRHFLELVASGALDDAAFYRVVRRLPEGQGPPTIDVVQGGLGFERAGETATVPHESTIVTGLTHDDGAVSLARGDGEAGGEFFITLGRHPILDANSPDNPIGQRDGFAVFGRVTAGMDLIRPIHQLKSDAPVPGDDAQLMGQFLDAVIPIAWVVVDRVIDDDLKSPEASSQPSVK